MNLKETTKSRLAEYNLILDKSLDQHFLINAKKIERLTKCITNEDIILEVGCGAGTITQSLIPLAKKIIGVEIDARFKPLFEQYLPSKKLELHFCSIWEIIDNIHCNKIVANLPYTIAESLLKYIIKRNDIQAMYLAIPSSFYNKISEHPVYTAFFDIKEVLDLDKKDFYPEPDTNSTMISVIRKNYQNSNDRTSSFIRTLYLQETKKVVNALRETLIIISSEEKSKLTKRQARQIIQNMKLSSSLVEKKVSQLTIEDYQLLVEKFLKLSKD